MVVASSNRNQRFIASMAILDLSPVIWTWHAKIFVLGHFRGVAMRPCTGDTIMWSGYGGHYYPPFIVVRSFPGLDIIDSMSMLSAGLELFGWSLQDSWWIQINSGLCMGTFPIIWQANPWRLYMKPLGQFIQQFHVRYYWYFEYNPISPLQAMLVMLFLHLFI